MNEDIKNQNNKILDNIIAASKNSDFEVAEDIYDSSDNKLLAKGYKITPAIREKLFNRILKKPIETCITSNSSVTSEELSDSALKLIKKTPLLSLISSDIENEANDLRNLKLETLASLLLTVMRDNGSGAFNHALFVTLLARSIANKMRIDQRDITNLSLSSLLHDIGELYSSFPEDGELSEENWHKVMVHPV